MIHAWLRLSFANSMRKKRRIPLANPGFSAGQRSSVLSTKFRGPGTSPDAVTARAAV